MKKISCNIIEDLLPIYINGVCSDETKELVESHIENCEDCQHKLELMKTNIIEADIEEKFDDSKRLNKLSETRISNTKIDIKSSLTTVLFYIFMIAVFLISTWMNEKARTTFMIEYQFADFFINAISMIVLGGLVAFLGGRPKENSKTNTLEFIFIGIPSLLMTFIIFIYYLLPVSVGRSIIGQNLTEITLVGGILLGCEIYRLIHVIRQKNVSVPSDRRNI